MDSELLTKCSGTSLYTQWRTAEYHTGKDVWLLCVTLNNTKRPLFLCMWQKNILLAVNFFFLRPVFNPLERYILNDRVSVNRCIYMAHRYGVL